MERHNETDRARRTSALVIDGDEAARGLLASFLHAMDWDVRAATGGAEAMALLDERPSCVIFVDWSSPGTRGLSACAQIRQRVWTERPYVIVTTGREPGEMWRALDAGADDVLRKPYERREVETRAALARFVIEGSARLPLAEAVTEALAAPAGELVLRQGHVLARLMFRAGRVVWAAVSPASRRFAHHLASELGLDGEQVRELLAECRATGTPFERLVAEWRLAEPEALRDCLRSWMTERLAQVREMTSPSVMFVPHEAGGLMFEGFLVGDVAPWLVPPPPPPRSSAPPSLRPDSIARPAALAMRIEGALAAFVLEARDGACVAQKGDRGHLEACAALARALHAVPPPTTRGSDILLSSSSCCYVARHLEQEPELLLVVAFDIAATTSGHARMQVARVASA